MVANNEFRHSSREGRIEFHFSNVESFALSGKMVKYQYKNCLVRTICGDLLAHHQKKIKGMCNFHVTGEEIIE